MYCLRSANECNEYSFTATAKLMDEVTLLHERVAGIMAEFERLDVVVDPSPAYVAEPSRDMANSPADQEPESDPSLAYIDYP